MKGRDFVAMLHGIKTQGGLYSAKRIATLCGMIMRYTVVMGRVGKLLSPL